ncbi:MAG: hypothetical protein HOV80_00405 [Polyangiaceae bacterium]|nr:hypothetical protein [Polyangiaceae bacterium]
MIKTSIYLALVCGAFVACGGNKAAPEADIPASPAVEGPSDMPPADDVAAASAAPTTEPAPAPAAEPPPLTVGAFKMTFTGKSVKTIEVGADGVARVNKDNKTLKFVKNELQDDSGKWIARVSADGSLEIKSFEREMKDGKIVSEKERTEIIGKFVDGDALEAGKGTLTLGDDGVVMILKAGATKPEPAVKEVKLSGVKPETRRAAMVLFVGLTFSGTAVTETAKASAPADPKAAPKADAPKADAKGDPKAAPKK